MYSVGESSTLPASVDAMRNRPAFDVWLIGVLTSFFCLLCLGGMVAQLGFDPLGFLPRGAPKPPATRPPLHSTAVQAKTNPPRAGSLPPAAATKLAPRRTARSAQAGATAAVTIASLAPPQPQKPVAQSAATTEPERKTLKPFGYVQKADGLVEAFVADEYGVHLVHVGDAYEEKFMVASTASDTVELVAASPQPTLSPPAEVVAASKSEPVPPKRDRPSVAVVNRVGAPYSVRNRGHAPGPPNSPPEPEGPSTSLVVANAPQNVGIPDPSLLVFTQHEPLASETLNGVEGPPGTEADPAFQSLVPPAIKDRERAVSAAANASDRLLAVEKPDTREPISAGEAVPAWRPSGLPIVASSGLDPPPATVSEGRGPPAKVHANTSIVKSYGYAEWEDGRTLAMLDDGQGGVRLVREGEVVDDRFRVVKVYQQAVEIAELPLDQSRGLGLLSLEAAAQGPKLPELTPPPPERSAQTDEVAEAELAMHPPPDPTTDQCGEKQAQRDAVAAQAHPPPDLWEPPSQQTVEDVLAGPSPPSTGPGIADSGKQVKAAPSPLWNFTVLGGSVPLFGLLPSAANADLSPAPRSSSPLAAPPGPGLGPYSAPSSGCSAASPVP